MSIESILDAHVAARAERIDDDTQAICKLVLRQYRNVLREPPTAMQAKFRHVVLAAEIDVHRARQRMFPQVSRKSRRRGNRGASGMLETETLLVCGALLARYAQVIAENPGTMTQEFTDMVIIASIKLQQA